MIEVCVCETQPIVVEGLRRSLEEVEDLKFLGSVSKPEELFDLIGDHTPTVCLIDKAFGTKSVFQAISDLKARTPAAEPILWASEISEVESFRALQVGARGILKKTLPIHHR